MISRLIEARDSVLIVIDVQSAFIGKLPPKDQETLVEKICSLVRVASELDVPVVVTAEEIPNLGARCARPGGEPSPRYRGPQQDGIRGLAGEPKIISAIRDTGRNTAVFVGLETDVYVAQSALGLLQEGFDVVAVADACGSPRATTVASRSGTKKARPFVPPVVMTPAVSSESFMVMGTP